MSKTAIDLINENKISKNKVLDLGNCGINTIPDEIYECTWITFLFLSTSWYEGHDKHSWQERKSQNLGTPNANVRLSSRIKELTNLRVLVLNGLGLDTANLQILSELKALEKLDIANNNISNINFLSTFCDLEELYIYNTNISELSPISSLKKLSTFVAFNTKIENIDLLQELTNLAYLDLKETRILKLPDFNRLINLKTLDISRTSINDVSSLRKCINLRNILLQFTKVVNIEPLLDIIRNNVWVTYKGDYKFNANKYETSRGICLTGCPISSPPVEVVSRGREAILNYFAERERIGVVKLFEAKLLIIGEGGAGKTTLARKMVNRNATMPAEEETTKGIEIFNYNFNYQDHIFRLNIWDFGGQEIYHSTHQFFLTKRSLYILLDDTRKDDKSIHDASFNYWLQVVDLLADKSPLIIVQNEKGDRSKEIDFKGMQNRFEIIKDRIKTNLLTLRNFDNVTKSIEFFATQLPHIGELLPSTWSNVRSELETLAIEGRNHISFHEYQDICKKYGIIQFEGALHLINYLHDLGVLLHWHDGSVLEDIVILKNSWATNAVYNLLDDEIIKIKQNGRFTNEDVDRVLNYDYAKNHYKIITALMEKNRFELIYKLPDSDPQAWLAPQLLPVEKPDLEEIESKNKDNQILTLTYDYDFMPKGIASRLIVRLNRYIYNIDYTWRLGVVLTRKDSYAIIEEAFGGRKLTVKCFGKLKKELITIISEDIDKLNSSFPGVKVHKFIPCNCELCIKSSNPELFDHADLLLRKERGKATIECSKSYNNVLVTELIDGAFLNVNNKHVFEKSNEYLLRGDLTNAMKLLVETLPEIGAYLSRLKSAENDYTAGLIAYNELEKIRSQITANIHTILLEYL